MRDSILFIKLKIIRSLCEFEVYNIWYLLHFWYAVYNESFNERYNKSFRAETLFVLKLIVVLFIYRRSVFYELFNSINNKLLKTL